MATYGNSQLTAAGLLLASRAASGQTKFKLTRTTSTAKDLSSTAVDAMTSLPNEVQTGSLTDNLVTRSSDHTIKTVEVLFTNRDLKAGYILNAIGIYAKEDGSNTEILYSVIKAKTAETIPSFADKVLLEFRLAVTVVVGQIENVTIDVKPTDLVTVTYLENQQTPVALGSTSFGVNTSKLDLNDYPRFKAWGYYNGAGIPQTTPYAGVPRMFEFTMTVDLLVNGQTMVPKFFLAQIKAALPDFDLTKFKTNRASDGKWMYLISEPATIGIECLNATFK
ncbi:hypothetical protein RA086_05660 [Lactiplantibacillus sp. WILCCON 0030]|uniref:Uncharacterized protein n=1 Tax=Lactiplantibacillus brownii TaxID=3069269 RepID=A0ABU1A9K0_9LACO|nr:hypothetical protein [Lactiplantibacillus brownii]MDQ7937113.1 hypothetical protein [Lactiplantibacillus brownii]